MSGKGNGSGADRLTPKEELVVQRYLLHLNKTRAVIEAGYSARTARQCATEVFARPRIVAAIAQARQALRQRLELEAEDVIRPLWDAVSADPNDIVQYRRHCCRYCYGQGFRWQRTAGEMERDREAHAERVRTAQEAGKSVPPPFDEKGGIGYDKRRAPNQDCPECFGDGLGEVFIPDTRRLTPEQLALYAGVKETKDGIEVKMHDTTARATLLMRHLGLLQDKVDHTSKGDKLPANAEPAVINVTIGKV